MTLRSHLLPTSSPVASSTQPAASLVCDTSAGHHGTGLRAPEHNQAAAGDRSVALTLSPGQPEGTDGRQPSTI